MLANICITKSNRTSASGVLFMRGWFSVGTADAQQNEWGNAGTPNRRPRAVANSLRNRHRKLRGALGMPRVWGGGMSLLIGISGTCTPPCFRSFQQNSNNVPPAKRLPTSKRTCKSAVPAQPEGWHGPPHGTGILAYRQSARPRRTRCGGCSCCPPIAFNQSSP